MNEDLSIQMFEKCSSLQLLKLSGYIQIVQFFELSICQLYINQIKLTFHRFILTYYKQLIITCFSILNIILYLLFQNLYQAFRQFNTMINKNQPIQDPNIFIFDQEEEDEEVEQQYQNQNQQNQTQAKIHQESSINLNNNNNFHTFRPYQRQSEISQKHSIQAFKELHNQQSQSYKNQNKVQHEIVMFDSDDDQIQQIEQQYSYQNHLSNNNSKYLSQKQSVDLNQLKKQILFSDKTNIIKTVAKPKLQKEEEIINKFNYYENTKPDFGEVVQRKKINSKLINQNNNQLIQIRKQQQKQNFEQFSEFKNQDKNSMVSTSQMNNLKEMVGANIKNEQFKSLEYVQQKKSLKVNNMKEFLFTQISPQYKINAIIKKVSSGFIYGTKYAVYIEENNKFLFSVLKDGLNKFIFSFSKENITEKNKNYLGKLVWNFYGSEFMLFDDGFDPSQTKSLEFCHRQIAYIKYDEQTGPRKFQAFISTNNNKGFHTIENQQNLIKEKWQGRQRKNICKFYSKKPTYDPIDGNYKLDFKGMTGQPSIKNFVLQNEEFKQSLIFGRRNKEEFAIQIRSPFSLMQAVAICISSIHYKVLL